VIAARHPDAARWDARYRDGARPTFTRPRAFLVEAAPLLPPGGLALDVAMGLGGNAAFLLRRGFRVVGVDISGVALRQAKARLPRLMTVQADLRAFPLPAETFDLILNFYYLQHDLWPAFRRALKPGGVLVFETLTQANRTRWPDLNPDHLLQRGELRAAFADWEVLRYREGWFGQDCGRPRAVAGLVARKPAYGR